MTANILGVRRKQAKDISLETIQCLLKDDEMEEKDVSWKEKHKRLRDSQKDFCFMCVSQN